MSAQRDWTINQDSEGIKIGWRMGHRQGRGVKSALIFYRCCPQNHNKFL